MKKAQVTAEKTAWLEIITHGQSHLSSSKVRGRYDRTLAQETEESFEGLATFALKGLRRLDPGTSRLCSTKPRRSASLPSGPIA